MAFAMTKVSYSGKIMEVTLGQGDKALKVGGENAYPFHNFEGSMPNKPVLAMEVWDMTPDDWPAACSEPFADVMGDPGAWAKKCVEQYGAEAIVLQLKSTDPNGLDAPPEKASEAVGKVLAAVSVPVVVWGSANPAKDAETLKKIAEDYQGKNLLLGPVAEDNHKAVGAAALAYKHSVIASSPIDVNLAKQLNILLGNLGVPMDKIVIDPTTGGLGYGMEYSYSVMERIRMAALVQDDDKLVLPLINNVGNEVWKSKEAKLSNEDAPELGDAAMRGVLMETTAAVSFLLAGSSILILRHPKTLALVKNLMAKLMAPRAAAAAKVKVDRPKAAQLAVAAAPKPAAAKPAAAAAPKPAAAPAAPAA
ncbi:MAG: acetyl-CoA decarbonylase/synthase complex subunit delta, partial [Desulfarculus sp.]|nr:acetyl-CoA decarbonylase/synthase complex subunit delta [Desulfarculus sp.]